MKYEKQTQKQKQQENNKNTSKHDVELWLTADKIVKSGHVLCFIDNAVHFLTKNFKKTVLLVFSNLI